MTILCEKRACEHGGSRPVQRLRLPSAAAVAADVVLLPPCFFLFSIASNFFVLFELIDSSLSITCLMVECFRIHGFGYMTTATGGRAVGMRLSRGERRGRARRKSRAARQKTIKTDRFYRGQYSASYRLHGYYNTTAGVLYCAVNAYGRLVLLLGCVRKSRRISKNCVAQNVRFVTVGACNAVPLILTLNSVLTTSRRPTGRFIKRRLNIDRVRARRGGGGFGGGTHGRAVVGESAVASGRLEEISWGRPARSWSGVISGESACV